MISLQKFQMILFVFAFNLQSILDNRLGIVKAEHGGQDLFTSLAQLEVLWHNDIKVVQQMEEVIRKMEIVINTFKS